MLIPDSCSQSKVMFHFCSKKLCAKVAVKFGIIFLALLWSLHETSELTEREHLVAGGTELLRFGRRAATDTVQ